MIISFTPSIEEIFQYHINKYFKEIKFAEIWEHYKSVNVSLIHPFEYFYAKLNGIESVQEELAKGKRLFPSVTIISDNENAAYSEIVNGTPCVLDKEFIEDLKKDAALPVDERFFQFALSDLEKLESFENIYMIRSDVNCRNHVTIEIWADNQILKNRIYDLLDLFLKANGRFELGRGVGLEIMDGTVKGHKGAMYNFDFGKTLYGATIDFDVIYQKTQFNSDIQVSNGVEIDAVFRRD